MADALHVVDRLEEAVAVAEEELPNDRSGSDDRAAQVWEFSEVPPCEGGITSAKQPALMDKKPRASVEWTYGKWLVGACSRRGSLGSLPTLAAVNGDLDGLP